MQLEDHLLNASKPDQAIANITCMVHKAPDGCILMLH